MSTRGLGALPDRLSVLERHYVWLSDTDEAEINRRELEADDVGAFALRTCRCGVRIDGFDAYYDHLREMLGDSR
jgi:hypothetical protein